MDIVYQIIDKRKYTHAKLATDFLCERDKQHLEKIETIGKKFDFVLGRNLLKNFLEKYCLQKIKTLELERKNKEMKRDRCYACNYFFLNKLVP